MIPICMTLILVLGAVCMQLLHYSFLDSQNDVADTQALNEEFGERLREFDEYKKRVDALTLRAGFKI